MIFRLFMLVLGLSLSTASQSEDYQAIALEAKNKAPAQIALYQNDANKAEIASRHLTSTYQVDAKLAELKAQALLDQYAESQGVSPMTKKTTPSILIFVSFSMPEQSLLAYLRDAKKIHASVVIRGLIDNSFPKTFQRMAKLVQASNGDGVELNPLWFKKFAIKKVPAVVVVQGDQYDELTGDVSLAAALRFIRDKGDSETRVASDAFDQLVRGAHA
jgi:type-F conjugative transfer system pilin assembly protein TrbC